MPRPPSAEIARRNQEIYARWRDGAGLQQLAEDYERSPQMIGRILASYHPDIDDEDDRSLHRGRLESLYQDIQSVIRQPGHMMAPNGRPATDLDGVPIANLGLKVEASRVQLAVLESMRKLDGRDAPSRRIHQLEYSVAEQQAQADIARREAELNRKLKLIQGSAEPVERPALPPAAEG